MAKQTLPMRGNVSFEELKKVNEHGAQFWSARELQPLLGYSQWRRFDDAVKRAMISCQQSGNHPDYHFAGAGKMVELGSRSVRELEDYHLSRFACYLIAQNGDPRKPEIAEAQKYFAIQARRQEVSDALAADRERLEIRKQTSEEFKALSGAAREAGVQDRMFRMTQTRDKLARERVNDQQTAILTHEAVGKEVREAIKRIGGAMPEQIPPAEHINEVEKRIKSTPPVLELEERDAKGLTGREDE